MIYLDYNATTPVDPRVLDEMLPYFTDIFANPASRQHAPGAEALHTLDHARSTVARTLSADPEEIVFTSGATEGCNLALKGVFHQYQRKGRHFVALTTEHKAVLDCLKALERLGAEVTLVDVKSNGLVDPAALDEAIRPDTVLVSVMWANNETGVIQPMQEIGDLCAQKGVMLFSDATQAAGKTPLDPRAAGVQLLAMSAHKCYGPKGIGAIYISGRSPHVRLEPLIHGGGHERGARSGTVNLPAVVGLATALHLAADEMTSFREKMTGLREQLEQAFSGMATINGRGAPRLPNVSNLHFPGVDGPALIEQLQPQLAIASGSACTSADPEPSHVLMGMGMSRSEAHASLRFSLGRFTTDEEITTTITLMREALAGKQ